MNLTIFALQTSIISMSPLFTKIQNLNIRQSTFSYFTSPILYNVYGKVEQSFFIKGLSSLVIIENADTIPIHKDLNSKESFEFKNNQVSLSKEISKPIIEIYGVINALGTSIIQNTFYNCRSKNDVGLIVLACGTNNTIDYNCFANCYSNGATILSITTGCHSSFVTSISEFYSNAICSFSIDNKESRVETVFNNINVSNSNLLEKGVFEVYSSSTIIKFLHFESSYNMNCFTVGNETQVSLENCEFFDLTAQFSIFSAESSFDMSNSYFFGLIFDNFIESPDSLQFKFINCGFDISDGLIKENFIQFTDCYFDIQMTFTNQAEFLNLGNCNGRNFTTYESILKQFSTEEILGMIFCVVGIVLSLIMIIARILSMSAKEELNKPKDYSDDYSLDYSDYSLPAYEEEQNENENENDNDNDNEEKPRKRK